MRRSIVAVALASAFTLLSSSHAAAVTVSARINDAREVGVEIEFQAEAVGVGDLTYSWDFGDGQTTEASPDATATHVYDEPGHYSVIVVARDDTGARTDSFLQTVHRALPEHPPTSSSTIVYHSDADLVCNVNADNDTVSCLSTESLEVVFETPVGRHPRTLAVAPDGTLWVTNQDDASITILDVDGEAVETIELPYASRPFGIVISAQTGIAYVTLQALGAVVAIDVTDRELLRQAQAARWATGIALDATAERIFVTRFISPSDRGEVVELDAESLEITRQLDLAVDPGPDTEATARGVPNYLRAVVPSPDGSELWLPSKKDNVERGEARDGEALTFETSVRAIVSMLDLDANQELLDNRVDLNNRALSLSLAFSPIGDYAFVGLLGNNGLEVLDAYNRQIVAGVFDLGKAPDGLVLDAQGRLYVSSFLSRSVVVLDATSLLASTDFVLDVIDEVVVSTEEKLDAEVLAGKVVFYDAEDVRMGLDGYISCAACHIDGFEDGQVWDFTDRGEGLRNTTSLLGRRGTGHGRLHWSANFDEVQDFEHDIRGPFGGEGFLSDELFEEGTRNTTLGDEKAGLSPELDALAAYVTSLDQVAPSPFRSRDGLLSEAGWRGLQVFERAGCPECHGGADFTDSLEGELHDVGTLRATSGSRLGGPLEGIDTPTLRGIWQTAPYLHDGSAATLREVVEDRNPDDEHGATSDLSDDELDDLVSYLMQIDNVALQDETEPPAAAASTAGGCSIQAATERSESHLGLGWMALLLALRRRGRRD